MPNRAEKLRKAYAASIVRRAGVADPRVEAAFAAVPREDFSGPAPWSLSGGLFSRGGEGDLAGLYDDVLVVIDAGRGINNGQPSLHAMSIAALAIEEGETVMQVGAGAGYYTAILAYLVGPTGKVFAYEIEADIAERARKNLASFPQVEVRARSAVGEDLPKADAIYVNAAASHPPRAWLEALNPGGRLLFPLQAAHSSGAMLLVTRPEEEQQSWPARMLTDVVFVACQGAQDPEMARRLGDAFRRGGAYQVCWLKFGAEPGKGVWLQGDGWALTMGEAG
ncbi:MAG TPA: methyltransferase domain-containing protein [Roseiarcus sp.]|jgi:protein-L-isoaspartate(D-aspartate) O-methyltransferase|nr:methyltransferase domain-containing protein [Roseiarcus sp.]